MRKRTAAGSVALMAALTIGVSGVDSAFAQNKDAKAAPKFLYGHDLRVRFGGKPDFNAETPRIGLEAFEDDAAHAIVAISETGSLAVAPLHEIGKERTCKWLMACDLSARKAGEADFTQKTKKFGIEVFKDLGSNDLLYISEAATMAFAPIPAGLVTDRGPKWDHAGEYKVRAYDQKTFDNAKRIGVETFKDENTGGLIYISESGSISTVPAPTAPKKEVLPPKTAYGLSLRVRGVDEKDWTSKTKRVEVEVFEDPNANTLMYITEAGNIAVVPNPGKLIDAKGVTWKHAMILNARKGGETSFEAAKKFSVEVFIDNRTENLVFISDTGSIAVLPKQ